MENKKLFSEADMRSSSDNRKSAELKLRQLRSRITNLEKIACRGDYGVNIHTLRLTDNDLSCDDFTNERDRYFEDIDKRVCEVIVSLAITALRAETARLVEWYGLGAELQEMLDAEKREV